jgi:hypothetical protein
VLHKSGFVLYNFSPLIYTLLFLEYWKIHQFGDTHAGFSVLCEALANGDEAMAIDIISTDRIYKFERVRIIET